MLRIEVRVNRPPPLPIGSSSDLKVGQKLFAIGNPFGLDYTLTTGIVSALNRSLQTSGTVPMDHMIQTDAAINPGNSGGPLLDSAGRLIGINTAIYSPSGAYAGIGFAVPVDTVNRVVPQLIAKGRYIQPVLGISADQEVNQIILRHLGIQGVAILGIEAGSAAQQAGLQPARITSAGRLIPGDVITAIDQQGVESVSQLLARLDDYAVGDEIRIDFWRDGEIRQATASLRGAD